MTRTLLVLFWSWLGLVPQLSAQSSPSQPTPLDTLAFTEAFADALYEQISDELSPAFGELYNREAGFVGLTLTAFRLQGGAIQEVVFSKDTPDSFKEGIGEALANTVLLFKGGAKSIIDGRYLLPIHFSVSRRKEHATTPYQTVADFFRDQPQYQTWFAFPHNKMAYAE